MRSGTAQSCFRQRLVSIQYFPYFSRVFSDGISQTHISTGKERQETPFRYSRSVFSGCFLEIFWNAMRQLAETCEAIAATTKKLQKIAIVAAFLKSRSPDEAAMAAVFLSGRAFPAWEETTLQVGGTLLWRVVAELSGKSEASLTATYRQHGDLGAVAGEVLGQRPGQGVGVLEVEKIFREIAAARGPAAKTALVRGLLARMSPLEAKYIVKIMTGDLRIGLKESLVEEAIAKTLWSRSSGSAARSAAGQHAAGRYRGDAAIGGRRQAGECTNANVSSAGIHAGQPS
jgi:hypothetical protein